MMLKSYVNWNNIYQKIHKYPREISEFEPSYFEKRYTLISKKLL